MSIRIIDKNIGTVPTWGDDDFDDNVHQNFLDLKEIIPKINITVADITDTANNLIAKDLSITSMKTSVENTKKDIEIIQNNINVKHSEVMNKVIPTESTYNPNTIDNKVRMSQILNLIGA